MKTLQKFATKCTKLYDIFTQKLLELERRAQRRLEGRTFKPIAGGVNAAG